MAVTDHPLAGLGYTRASEPKSFVRLTDESSAESSAEVAEEVPIALVYNGRPYVVVMGTPTDLEDLAVGFSVTEGIVAGAAAIERIEVVRANHGIELQMQISAADAERLGDRARSLVARTGCGLCGIETIGDVLRSRRSVPRSSGRPVRALARERRAVAPPIGEQRHERGARCRLGGARRRASDRSRGCWPTQRPRQSARLARAERHIRVERLHRCHQPGQLRDGAEGRDVWR